MTGITGFQLFWWVILPYLALATFVIGHIWRYRYDQFGWTSRSTELQEKKLLEWGIPISLRHVRRHLRPCDRDPDTGKLDPGGRHPRG